MTENNAQLNSPSAAGLVHKPVPAIPARTRTGGGIAQTIIARIIQDKPRAGDKIQVWAGKLPKQADKKAIRKVYNIASKLVGTMRKRGYAATQRGVDVYVEIGAPVEKGKVGRPRLSASEKATKKVKARVAKAKSKPAKK